MEHLRCRKTLFHGGGGEIYTNDMESVETILHCLKRHDTNQECTNGDYCLDEITNQKVQNDNLFLLSVMHWFVPNLVHSALGFPSFWDLPKKQIFIVLRCFMAGA